MPGLIVTGFQEAGVDIGVNAVEKSYLMDVYPQLVDWQKAPGLWMCGRGASGEMGDATTIAKSSPVQTIAGGANWKQASCGYQFTSAIKTDGTLWLWGFNSNGQMGDNTTAYKSSPVQTVTGGTNWKQVACGGPSIGAIKTDGTLWMWGNNYSGVLGNDSITGAGGAKSSPIQTVSGGNNWSLVSTSGYHTAAIKTDGTLWTWGQNNHGQLGDNTTTSKSSPVQTVTGGTNWKQVAGGYHYTSAIKTDGTLWTWGYNAYGVLGDNTTTSKSSPVQTVAGGTNWKQISHNSNQGRQAGAIKTDGTLWRWGQNNHGQLGDGTIVNKSSPVQTIAGGSNWKQISIGSGYHAAAIKESDGF